MKHIAFITVVFCSSLCVTMSNSLAQDENSGKWSDPLKIGVEYSNITDIGPVIQYNIFNSLHVTCKLQYNTDIEEFFVLPGIKYNFKQIKYGLSPFIELQYTKLDYVKYNKLYYNGAEVLRYCDAWDYDPLTGVSTCIHWVEAGNPEKKNSSGASLFAGIEYPINKFVLNAGIGTSYFPDIESDEKSNFLWMYLMGIYFSF